MVKNNKTCILCGKKYTYCGNCAEFENLPHWMICYCSKNCKDIFDILSAYNMKQITKEEAKEAFEKCDLSYKQKFYHTNLDCINTIMSTADETTEPVHTAGQVTTAEKPIMNAPEPLPETTITFDESIIKTNKISDPVMGDTAIKQPKRMKYTKKK